MTFILGFLKSWEASQHHIIVRLRFSCTHFLDVTAQPQTDEYHSVVGGGERARKRRRKKIHAGDCNWILKLTAKVEMFLSWRYFLIHQSGSRSVMLSMLGLWSRHHYFFLSFTTFTQLSTFFDSLARADVSKLQTRKYHSRITIRQVIGVRGLSSLEKKLSFFVKSLFLCRKVLNFSWNLMIESCWMKCKSCANACGIKVEEMRPSLFCLKVERASIDSNWVSGGVHSPPPLVPRWRTQFTFEENEDFPSSAPDFYLQLRKHFLLCVVRIFGCTFFSSIIRSTTQQKHNNASTREMGNNK